MTSNERISDHSTVLGLLRRIDKGYLLTDIEKQELSKVGIINWSLSDLSELPKSLSLLTSLTSLDLSSTKVIDISALSNLTMLTDLSLSFTQVKDISTLSNLTRLENLRLDGTQVRDISALSNLKSLKILGLSNTQVKDISVLSNLTRLEFLRFNDTQVKDISALSNLTTLEYLRFNDTQVKDISALSNLKKLSILYLNGTQVNDISALSGLLELGILDLSRNEIKDLGVLSRLENLKYLNIQDSKLKSIPESLLDLDLNFITEAKAFSMLSGSGIYIHGLTLTDQPIEIFSQSKELIRAYYRERKKVAVNECKVIFLGDAESGKTHSIRRLLKKGEYLNDEDFDGKSTPGIETTVSKIKLNNSNIIINYWDFGGQEIQHSMHRMFLTERTVYVVFLNARQDDQMDERARYWLENLKAFAPDAPVLVVINKIDENNHPRFNEVGITSDSGKH